MPVLSQTPPPFHLLLLLANNFFLFPLGEDLLDLFLFLRSIPMNWQLLLKKKTKIRAIEIKRGDDFPLEECYWKNTGGEKEKEKLCKISVYGVQYF